MNNITKAGISAKVKKQSIIKLTAIATVAVVGMIFCVYNFIEGLYVFSLLYFIAAILGTLYAVIKINTIIPPSIECDSQTLYMSTWENCILPFNINVKPTFFADFIPARTKYYEIPLCEISSVVIGSKGFIVRSSQDGKAEASFYESIKDNRRVAELAKRCDIFYITLKSNNTYFMSVNDFDVDELYKVVDKIGHSVHGLEFKTNIRKLRKKWEAGSAMNN